MRRVARATACWTTVFAGFVVLAAAPARATTWAEPWTDEIAREADVFAEIEILTSSPVEARVVKTWAGTPLPDRIRLADRFFMLRGQSLSSHGPHLRPYPPGSRMFVLLKAGEAPAVWRLATPTGGQSVIQAGVVQAEVRHSLHQALLPTDMYVTAMTAIFRALHGEFLATDFLDRWVAQYLTQPPSVVDRDLASGPSRLFFAQHVTLECLVHLGRSEHADQVVPFVTHPLIHHRISAVRALGRIGGDKSVAALLERVEKDPRDFVKVLAVRALARLRAHAALAGLQALEPTADTRRVAFGADMNIMDPRTGTSLPSVKDALQEAIRALQASEN